MSGTPKKDANYFRANVDFLTIASHLVYNARMPQPTPLTDLESFLRSQGIPKTRENILMYGKMLSMTEAELALALTLVDPKAVKA